MNRKKKRLLSRTARAVALTLVLLAGEGSRAFALPVPAPSATPSSKGAATSPSPAPTIGPVLPSGSEITFILEQEVNTASIQAGFAAPIKLNAPLVVGGITVAPSGTETVLRVISVRKAKPPDVDGQMQVAVDPLPLKDGAALPLHLRHELLSGQRSKGEQSTEAFADMVGTVFLPGYIIMQLVRKGQDFVFPKGTTIKAVTSAAIDARDPSLVVITSPRPVIINDDPVHSDYSPPPFYGPSARPTPTGTPRPQPSAPARPSPTPLPSPSPLPSPAVVPTPQPGQSPAQ